MDRKSNRTDLLAAGREKLRQYRQKKDNKGKDGKGKDGKGNSKSTNKAVKSGKYDDDADTTSAIPKSKAESSKLPEQEVESNSSGAAVGETMLDSSISSLEGMKNSEGEDASSSGPEYNIPNGQGDINVDAHEGVVSSAPAGLVILYGDAGTSTPDSTSEAACDAATVTEALPDADGQHEIDNVVLEASNTIPKNCHQSLEVDVARESILFMSALDGGSETPTVATNIPGHTVSEHDGEHETVNAALSVDTSPVSVETAIRSPQKLLHRGNVMGCSSSEKPIYLQSIPTDFRCFEGEGNDADLVRESNQCDGKQSLFGEAGVIGVESRQSLIEDRNICSVDEQPLFPGVTDNFVNLSMLAEVLKRLPDSDFRYLIKSREIGNCSSIVELGDQVGNLPQMFQEQLYVVNIMKDFFNLQLLEQHEQQTDLRYKHHHPLDQVPVLTSPCSDFEERSRSLAVELSQCRSELGDSMRERGELQNLYNIAKREVLESSTKVNELQMRLEESAGQLSSLTGELVNCKVILEALQEENQNLLENLSSVTEQRNKSKEVMEQYIRENRRLLTDLADSGAQSVELQLEISNLKMSLASVEIERNKLEEEKNLLVQEKGVLSGELVDCKPVVSALQQENASLNMNLALVMEEQNQLKEHAESLSQEIERLSGELLVSKDKLPISQEYVQLEAQLKEAMSHLEQLAEENIILQSSLEIHKAKLAEVDCAPNHLSSQARGVETGSKCTNSATGVDGSLHLSIKDEGEAMVSSIGPAVDDTSETTVLGRRQELGLQNDVSGVVLLNVYLEEAEKMIQQLENAINGLYSQSATPGVSKLIQAFESKANVDAHDSDGTEDTAPFDPYSSAKGNISHLRTVLISLSQTVEHVNALLLEKDGHKAAAAACAELEVENEYLKGINYSLEMRNIELEVLCVAMKQHAHDIEAKAIQLECFCEDLKQKGAILKSQNTELVEKLNVCHSRIHGLQSQLIEIRRSSDEASSTIHDGVKTLQNEMRDDIYAIDRKWKSATAEVALMVEKLNTVVGSAASFHCYSEASDDWDIFGHFSLSLNAACEVIEQLRRKLEDADKEQKLLSNTCMEANEKLLGLIKQHNVADALLQKISNDLVNLLNIVGERIEVSEIQAKECNMHDSCYYDALLAKLESLLVDQLQLKESYSKLHSDLLSKTKDIEELKKTCLNEHELSTLVHDIKDILQLQDAESGLSDAPVLILQSSVSSLIQKYREAEIQINLLTNDMNSRLFEISDLHGRVELLDSVNFQQENEILLLKESLTHAKNIIDDVQAELLSKVRELELSEQRVASVREKLSIAVAKGKGLVAQRDSLKQSLAEMSGELEKYSQELQVKDSRIHEVEEKLKAYSEAGERMEALESELSYIRNSATALRESFVLKDSTLQRIEEILEDLELPDHFHSKDIIEKVDWLAKLVTSNSLPADWDRSNSAGAVSYSDAGFVVSDACKDDLHASPNPIDDLRRKYDELQAKFYELAEQNDMLEQSLLERNILVQRWEEILDRINTPPQIRSMEPEERIHWLGTALSEADNHMRSLQQKVEKLENYCGSLSFDLEESQRKLSEHEVSLQAVLHEKERMLLEAEDNLSCLEQKIDSLESYCSSLSANLEESRRRISELEPLLQEALSVKEILSCNFVTLNSDLEIALISIAQSEHEIDKLGKEIIMLQGKLAENLRKKDHICWIESEVRRLQSLILDVLQDSGTEDVSSDVNDIQYLEQLIGRVLSSNARIDSESHKPREAIQEHSAELLMATDMGKGLELGVPGASLCEPKSTSAVCEVQDLFDLRRELAVAVNELAQLKEERDAYMQKNQSLASAFEVLEKEMKEFQDRLNQEELKSASLREKLNLAVRKGKSLVQQRDSLKQNNDEMSVEIQQLKSKINDQERSLSESRQKISDLTLQIERFKASESDNLSLKNQLMETEKRLEQDGHTLSMLCSKLDEIDAGGEIDVLHPVQKLEVIVKQRSDLQATAASFEQEAKKSKKAAELLLAELNEVQERNDGLQEELARTYNEISVLSRERDLADSAKIEALSHLNKFSEERSNQIAESKKVHLSLHEVKRGFFEICTLANDVFRKDIELVNNVATRMKSCLQETGMVPAAGEDFLRMTSANSGFKDWSSTNFSWDKIMPHQLDQTFGLDAVGVIGQHLQQLTEGISALKDRIHSHSVSINSDFEQLNHVISSLLRESASQRNSLQTINDECVSLVSKVKEREMDFAVIHRSTSLLYEACTSAVLEIENRRAQWCGESLAAGDERVSLPALPLSDGANFSQLALSSYENCVKTLADRLLLAVKDIVEIMTESVEGSTKEMRSTILNLQNELQDKDIQREQICMELVSQMKNAEATAVNYSHELQSMKSYTQDLQSKLETADKEQNLLKLRVEELQREHLSSVQLGEKVKSLTDLVAAKEQEIEALMQALDEEENQMEALRSKIDDFEKVVVQKNMDLEHVEASRAKALKKLSVTVSKFDELHHMSEGLLSEIENLQSQLQDRDAEISFLRQEVTRCTNDALEATKMVKDRNSRDFHDFLTWLDGMFSSVLTHESCGYDDTENDDHILKEHLQKDIASIICELQDLRVAAQRKDTLLQIEKNRVAELSQRKEALEVSLQEKELHLNSLQGVEESGPGTSEIVEVEPLLNKWIAPATSATTQVRSLRKVNNDQVSIAIDTVAGSSGRFEDEEDDKVHGFKSLTTSRFVPKLTRPVSDMIDGLWVSCDRTLMRQPAFRLAIMIYWAFLHALLASFIV